MEPVIARQMVISLASDLMVDSGLETCGRQEIELEMDCVWVESHQAGGYSHSNKTDIINDICTLFCIYPLDAVLALPCSDLISVATTKKGSI